VASGEGNQRGSIFRRHVGAALMDTGRIEVIPDWLVGSNATASQRVAERAAERAVSLYIGRMPFLFLPIEDAAGPDSDRGYFERNAIALLTSAAACALDPPSPAWLGRHARKAAVRESGLWNVRHVGEAIDDGFLDRLSRLVPGGG
jgi:hypothetical protein